MNVSNAVANLYLGLALAFGIVRNAKKSSLVAPMFLKHPWENLSNGPLQELKKRNNQCHTNVLGANGR
jgi:hypothetical protein